MLFWTYWLYWVSDIMKCSQLSRYFILNWRLPENYENGWLINSMSNLQVKYSGSVSFWKVK